MESNEADGVEPEGGGGVRTNEEDETGATVAVRRFILCLYVFCAARLVQLELIRNSKKLFQVANKG